MALINREIPAILITSDISYGIFMLLKETLC